MTDWSAQAIARRIMTKTDENRIEPPLQPAKRELPATVVVTDIRMPFGSMVTFMVKWAIASIPAAIILFALAAVFWGLLTVRSGNDERVGLLLFSQRSQANRFSELNDGGNITAANPFYRGPLALW